MALQLRRGSDTARASTVFAAGEPVWTTDTTQLYVGDGVTTGGVLVASGNQNVNTNSNVTFNSAVVSTTATVATLKFGDGTTMTTAASGSGSTNTFVNAIIDTELSIGTGTYRMLLGQSPTPYDNQFYITGNSSVNDKLFFDNFNLVQINTGNQLQVESTATFNGAVGINNTLTVQSLTVALNTGTTARDFGYGNMPFNANNMKIEVPYNGASLFFAFKNPGGAARNVGFSRQGNIVLQQGTIGLGFPNGIQLVSQDGGRAFVGVSTTTNGVLYSSRVGANTSTGVFQTVENNAGVNFSTLLDYTGLFTVPRDLLVATTATVAGLVLGSDPVITSRSELIGPTGPTGPTGQSSSIYDYKAKTTITSGDPGSNYLIWNNATQQSATEIILSHIDFNGEDIEYLLGFLTTGDRIRIQDQLISENYQDWLITGPAVTTTASYVTLPVSLTTSTHTFGNNDRVVVINRVAGAVGPTGPAGATGPTGPGADQSLNTNSNVTFANANITTRIDASAIYANATTQDLSLTANFNGLGSGAGGSVNIFSANGSAALPKVEILGDAINFKSADSTVNYGGFGFDTGLSVSTTATVGALRFGTETAITSRSELIGPTGPAGGTGPTGPAGATGGYSGTESVYALGNTSGTLSVDATSATIFTMTLTGNLTMNAMTNVVTGSNATFVITQDGTGGRTLTSSWKFAGGAKTLTTAGTATDLISVFYDGSNYWASLSRGFV